MSQGHFIQALELVRPIGYAGARGSSRFHAIHENPYACKEAHVMPMFYFLREKTTTQANRYGRIPSLLTGLLLLFIFASLYAQDDNECDDPVTPLLPQEYFRTSTGAPYRLRICYNWQCTKTAFIELDEQDLDTLRLFFYCAAKTPFDQLQQIRLAVAELEHIAERQIPVLGNDLGGNLRDLDQEGRMDCVDNASNTGNYLQFLRQLGLITRFEVGKPARRGGTYLGRHYTAVLWELDAQGQRTAQGWTVDSWFRDNGKPPYILPLADWEAYKLPWKPPYADLNPLYYDYKACLSGGGEMGW